MLEPNYNHAAKPSIHGRSMPRRANHPDFDPTRRDGAPKTRCLKAPGAPVRA